MDVDNHMGLCVGFKDFFTSLMGAHDSRLTCMLSLSEDYFFWVSSYAFFRRFFSSPGNLS